MQVGASVMRSLRIVQIGVTSRLHSLTGFGDRSQTIGIHFVEHAAHHEWVFLAMTL